MAFIDDNLSSSLDITTRIRNRIQYLEQRYQRGLTNEKYQRIVQVEQQKMTTNTYGNAKISYDAYVAQAAVKAVPPPPPAKPRLTKDQRKALNIPRDVLFPFSDLRAFVKALKAGSTTVWTRFDYNADTRRKMLGGLDGDERRYEVPVDVFMTKFYKFYNKYIETLTQHRFHLFSTEFKNHEEAQGFMRFFSGRGVTRENKKIIVRELIPYGFHNQSSLYFDSLQNMIGYNGTGRITKGARKILNYNWLNYEQRFVNTLQVNLVPTTGNGLVTQEVFARDFFQCEMQGCGRTALNTQRREHTIRTQLNPVVENDTDDTMGPDETPVAPTFTERQIPVCTRCQDNVRRGYQAAVMTAKPLPILNHDSNPLQYVKNGKVFRVAKGEKVTDDTLYFGIELECMPSDKCVKKYGDEAFAKSARICNNSLNLKNNLCIIKHDGSLRDANTNKYKGFEIVSIPGTHLFHTTEGWEDFFRKGGPHEAIAGWDHPECGIHIHVGRAALSNARIGKLLVFANDTKNRLFVEHVAGRNHNRYSKYIEKKLDGSDANSGFANPDRYQAINLQTLKPTIEFRIFRSNTAKHGFLKNIDFVHALCTWAEQASLATFTDKEVPSYKPFLEWCNKQRGTYKFLTQWLVKHKYLKEIHKFNAEYMEPILMEA